MNIEWLKQLPDKKLQEDIENLLRNTFVRETFLGIIMRMQEEEERIETSLKSYDNPSWAYKQADLNGARRAYNKIRSLFDLKSKES